ncbi:hypothetical protein ANRL2_04582 [Anaerolineae bacterium]|nr:hypothetical protein ANRL2_04582 [Anaerolineae bacterium]
MSSPTGEGKQHLYPFTKQKKSRFRSTSKGSALSSSDHDGHISPTAHLYTIFGLGIGMMNLPPFDRYSSCCFMISAAKFQARMTT